MTLLNKCTLSFHEFEENKINLTLISFKLNKQENLIVPRILPAHNRSCYLLISYHFNASFLLHKESQKLSTQESSIDD